jgi:hypothetical protein
MALSAMAKIWRNRIEAGTQIYSDCPAKYRPDVLTYMRQDVTDGLITAEEFKTLTGEDV